MPPPQPSAGTITVGETMTLLDGRFAALTRGVANGQYAVWLGSGISLARVEGLRDVVTKVVEHLQARVDAGDTECRFGKALQDVLEIAQLRSDELERIDIRSPIGEWTDGQREMLVHALLRDYSGLLDVRV